MRVKKIELDSVNLSFCFQKDSLTYLLPGHIGLLEACLNSCSLETTSMKLKEQIPPKEGVFFVRIYFEDDQFYDYGFSERELIYNMGPLYKGGYLSISYDEKSLNFSMVGNRNNRGNSLIRNQYSHQAINYINEVLRKHPSFSDVLLLDPMRVEKSGHALNLSLMGNGYKDAILLLLCIYLLKEDEMCSFLTLRRDYFSSFDRGLTRIILTEASTYGINIIQPHSFYSCSFL